MPEKDRYSGNEMRIAAQVMLMPIFMLGYIGAQTGSLIIQAVIAASVGAAVAIRLYWGRIKKLFTRGKNSTGDTAEAVAVEDNTVKATAVDGCDNTDRKDEADSLERLLLPDPEISAGELDLEITGSTSTVGETGIEE